MKLWVRNCMLFLAIAAIGTWAAQATECVTPRAWQPKLAATPLDTNANYIADTLDELPSGSTITAVVSLNRCPVAADLSLLVTKGAITFQSKFISIVVMTGTAGNLRSLATESFVSFVDEDRQVFATLDVSNPAIKVRASATYTPNTIQDQYGFQGTGINIAIIDTGVDNGVHADLPNARFVGGYNTFTNVVGDPDDDQGHGTHVAGIVLGSGATFVGIAPMAGLVDIKVLNAAGSGTYAGILQGMEKLLDNRVLWDVRVANMSLGDCTNSNGTDSLSEMVNRMVYEGLVIAVAAGNSPNCGLPNFSVRTPSPGAADDAITVANSDDIGTIIRTDDTISGTSLQGPRPSDGDLDTADELKPDLGAPGTSITSALFNTAAGYVAKSGTSMAAPHVAGCAALVLQAQPTMTPLAVKDLFIRTAEDKAPAGWDGAYGNGLIDCFAAANQLVATAKTDLKFNVNTNSGGSWWFSPDLYPTNASIVEGTPNTINAVITNGGPLAVSGFKVNLGVYGFSNSQQNYHICTVTVSAVLASGGTVTVNCPWTPSVSGLPPGVVHACLKAEIIYPFDLTFVNNKAQHNIDIKQTQSPATFRMSVVNPTNEDLTIQLRETFLAGTSGWTLTKSMNNFLLPAVSCPQLVTLQMNPGLNHSQSGSADVEIVGIRQNSQEISLGGVRVIATVSIPFLSRRGVALMVLLFLGSGILVSRRWRHNPVA